MEYDPEQKQMAMITRHLSCPGRDILEIGCGEGRVSALLAPQSRSYIAIDIDVQSIDRARAAYPEVDFRVGNGEDLDFGDASLDGVLFTLSLHHQDSPSALSEAQRVLKQGGRAVVLEPAAEGEFEQFFSLFNDETEALNRASDAIARSSFVVQAHETFDAAVRFHDQTELCRYPFDRVNYRPDDCERILNLLEQLRGMPAEGAPIRLTETLHIYKLVKGGGRK